MTPFTRSLQPFKSFSFPKGERINIFLNKTFLNFRKGQKSTYNRQDNVTFLEHVCKRYHKRQFVALNGHLLKTLHGKTFFDFQNNPTRKP